ncbi:unnamed protein product [Dovyalis caffra]|uniref:Uncharacterized protein n=1 Tax=Dovyalis caffra TaxID=77055 RepID=A0AAV1RH02_9ROSI|nr:unnamed protein product [Dovyalis caffra]
MSLSLEALAMAGTNYLEWGVDVEEWEDDDSELPPPHLLVEEVRDHRCGFPVTYISFPCHPLQDSCDGDDDNDSDQIAKYSHPKPEETLAKRKTKLMSTIGLMVKAIIRLLMIAGLGRR